LLCKTDGIGDLVVSLPLQNYILDKDPSAEVFWLVKPDVAPILKHLPGVSGVLHGLPGGDLEQTIKDVKPDALLQLGRGRLDRKMITAAKRAAVPCRVAHGRCFRETFGITLKDGHLDRLVKHLLTYLEMRLNATHIIWNSFNDRHESQSALDLLKAMKWPVPDSIPPPPKLVLTQEEIACGKKDLQNIKAPRLGVITKGKSCASPSQQWWKKMLEASKMAGWNPVILSPLDECSLPPTDIRGLMGRLYACDAVLAVSTGAMHIAAALGVPTLCLMERDISHCPKRWAPLGHRAEGIAYPGDKVKFGAGMDRFSPDTVLAHLEKLCVGAAR
jgi:hypothetical protein